MIFKFDQYEFINESNRIQQYFEDNPDKLQKFAELDLSMRGKDTYDDMVKSMFGYENNPIQTNYYKQKTKLEQWFNDNQPSYTSNSRYEKSIFGLLEDRIEYMTEYYRKPEWSYVENHYVIKDLAKTFTNYEEIVSFIKDNWKYIYQEFKKIKELKAKSYSYSNMAFRKEAKSYGFTPETFAKCLSQIKGFTASSRTTIPQEFWPVLKALTVNKNKLPSTIYRGIFYDGAKIKDREAFQKKWAKGQYPGEALRKSTSWSSAENIANTFTVDQDFIKDRKNGFRVIMAIDNPTEDIIIADFRSLWFSTFWNQQELIVDPKAKNLYYVKEIVEHEDYDNSIKDYSKQYPKWKEATKHIKGSNGGAMGSSFKEIIKHWYIAIDTYDIDKNLKLELKGDKDMTAREFFTKWDAIPKFNEDKYYKLLDSNILLYSWIQSQNIWINDPDKVTKNSISGYINIGDFNYSTGSELRKIIGKTEKDIKDMNLKYGEDRVLLKYSAKLLSTNWNNIMIKITFDDFMRIDDSSLNNWRVDHPTESYEELFKLCKSKRKEFIEHIKKYEYVMTRYKNVKIIF